MRRRAITKLQVTFVIILILASAIAASFLLSGPSGTISPEQKFITVKDMAGESVEIPKPVRRAVILQPYWVEVAYVLGAGDKIVGVGKYVKNDVFLPDAIRNKTVVGSTFTGINLETVISLNPDVVITDIGYGRAEEIAKSLKDQGIPVVRMFCRSFKDQLRAIEIIGKVLNAEKEAAELIQYLSHRYSSIINITSKIPQENRPTVLIGSFGGIKEGMVYVYSNASWGKAVEDLGGINVALREMPNQPWPKVNIEKVLSWNPDIIIVVAWDRKTLNSRLELLKKEPWNRLDAVRNGKVYGILAGGMEREAFLDWGPRELIGYMQLAKLIHPNYFKDLDWRKEADNLLSKFYHIRQYITVEDVRGRNVTIPYPVERAAVLQGYEIVLALQAFDRVVAVQEHCYKVPILLKTVPNLKEIPAVASSGAKDINLEALLATDPDVVITWDLYPKVIDNIESLGIPVIAIHPKNYTMLKEMISLLGKIFGKEKRAEEIISYMEEVIDLVKGRVKQIPKEERLKAILVYDLRPYVWGWGTTYSQIFEMAGLIDVTKEGGLPSPGWGVVPLETVIKWNPDIIFLHWWSKNVPDDIYNNPKWQEINAVKNEMVYKEPYLSSWAPESVLLPLYCATKAYPSLFRDINFTEFHKEFFRKCYGVGLEPQFMG